MDRKTEGQLDEEGLEPGLIDFLKIYIATVYR